MWLGKMDIDLHRENRPHCVWSVLVTSVNLSFRPPAHIVQLKFFHGLHSVCSVWLHHFGASHRKISLFEVKCSRFSILSVESSSVNIAQVWCLGGHGLELCRRFGILFCFTLVIRWTLTTLSDFVTIKIKSKLCSTSSTCSSQRKKPNPCYVLWQNKAFLVNQIALRIKTDYNIR